ncbi:DUF2255 family protein [Lacisediminihabitans profunda]|uniref:DUF2255 family protein n=1 Tax=Lacisediminihabitans profunda TaxID=2594790 RepID=A0A5C8UWH0_9MICO|nr:DUF2255 family protein [Lacisediminihabitans profunda]TXN32393.1 DUF2255 family protein [Lacisediminihabitans profunda]
MDWDQLVSHLGATTIVGIVTERADGTAAVAPIWAVVVDGQPYVRSYLGPTALWYRRVLAGRPVFFTTGDGEVAERDTAAALLQPRVAVRTEYVDPGDPIQAAIDGAFLAKYREFPEADEMTQPAMVACTRRILPAEARPAQ